ncbi:phage holin family protein [Glaciimonas sp. GG7]
MTNTLTQLLTVIALLGYAATCLQLLCYRRGIANYRIQISVVAWLLIVFTGTRTLEILLGSGPISVGDSGLAITLCALVQRAQGNVANMLRGNR